MKPIKFIIPMTIAVCLSGCATTYNVATQKEEFILMTPEKEVNVGRNIARAVEEKFEIEPDPLVRNRVKEIGKKIAAASDRQSVTYHFEVLADDDEDKVNAFALPGGYVYIFKALIDRVESDDELAAVLAHEVGHIAARHSAKRAQGSLGDSVLQLLMVVSGAQMDGATRARIHEALNQLMMSYSRDDEVWADRLSIKYLRTAGYNPDGAITFLERLMEIQRKSPLRKYHRYRTHPYLSERISFVRGEVRGRMDFKDYINISDEVLETK